MNDELDPRHESEDVALTPQQEEFLNRAAEAVNKTAPTVPPTPPAIPIPRIELPQPIVDNIVTPPSKNAETRDMPENNATIPPARVDPNMTLAPFQALLDDDTCPHCHATRYVDAKFCHNCGAVLVKDAVELCQHCKTALVPQGRFCYKCGKSVDPVPELTLMAIDMDKKFTLRGEQDSYTVGREVPEQSNYVDIDLGTLGQRKISRQHARFFLFEKVWYLEDMGSKAGTRISTTKLSPNEPMQLQNGMVVYFADLKFKIEIQEA